MAKQKAGEIAKRRLRLLAEVVIRGMVPIEQLARELQVTTRTVESDVDELRSMDVPIECTSTEVILSPVRMEALWKGADVGDRFQDSASVKCKRRVARRLVAFLKKRDKPTNTILVGTGTTAYYCAEHILACWDDLRIGDIYTSSVLVLGAFVRYRHLDTTFHMMGGDLDRQTAWLRGSSSVLGETAVDAVVTSFLGLLDEGFTTKQEYEIADKLMNLRPHAHCKLVLIPVELSKIGRGGGHLIAAPGMQAKPENVLEFGEHGRSKRQYYIITDKPPRGVSGREQRRILNEWKKRGVRVLWTDEP